MKTLFACPSCHHVSFDSSEINWRVFDMGLLKGCKGILLQVCPSCKHHGLKENPSSNPWEQILGFSQYQEVRPEVTDRDIRELANDLQEAGISTRIVRVG